MKKIIQKANTPSKRIGLLCHPLSLILAIGGAVHWSIYKNRWGNSFDSYFRDEVFDLQFGHYVIINFIALLVLLLGIALYFGLADKISSWVKTGKTDT